MFLDKGYLCRPKTGDHDAAHVNGAIIGCRILYVNRGFAGVVWHMMMLYVYDNVIDYIG